jgi:hypothetical protein
MRLAGPARRQPHPPLSRRAPAAARATIHPARGVHTGPDTPVVSTSGPGRAARSPSATALLPGPGPVSGPPGHRRRAGIPWRPAQASAGAGRAPATTHMGPRAGHQSLATANGQVLLPFRALSRRAGPYPPAGSGPHPLAVSCAACRPMAMYSTSSSPGVRPGTVPRAAVRILITEATSYAPPWFGSFAS